MASMPAKEFEDRYLALFWKWRRQQWDNYLGAAHHDLCAVDREMFDLVSSHRGKIDAPGRRGQVQNAIILRDLVDKHPDVARLRNKLDDWDNYSQGLSAAQKQNRLGYRLVLARRMKDDVLQLMETRQRLARQPASPVRGGGPPRRRRTGVRRARRMCVPAAHACGGGHGRDRNQRRYGRRHLGH